MPYSKQARDKIFVSCILLAVGVFLGGWRVLDHYRNLPHVAEFRADPACLAPLAVAPPAHSALCEDDSAVVTARWSERAYKGGRHYYLALRVADGNVDTLRIPGGPDTWDLFEPGARVIARQFAPKDWAHAHVVAFVRSGTAAQTAYHPVWRDGELRILRKPMSIIIIGPILLMLLVAVVERERKPVDVRDAA